MNADAGIARLLLERQVGDAGRVLVVLKGTRLEEQTPVQEEQFHSYMFLLNCLETVPTNYRFVFGPLPFSSEMDNDMLYLGEAGWLSKESPIQITDSGEEWVGTVLREDEALILNAIRENVAEWRTMSRGQLFEAAYRAYVSR